MSTEHSLLRSTIDSAAEATRLLARYDKRDFSYVFTNDDVHSIRGISNMLSQAAKSAAELSGYVECKIWGKNS